MEGGAINIMNNKINKVITNLKEIAEKDHVYEGKKWRRSHSNQPGVYDVKLNLQQIIILDEALKKEGGPNSFSWATPVFSRKKWNTTAIEIFQDYQERIKQHRERKKNV